MNRKFLTLFLVLISLSVAYGWPKSKEVPTVPGAIHGWDNASATWRPVAINPADGKLVTDTSVTFSPTPPSVNSTSVANVSSTVTQVTALSNRNSISLFNHSATETVWVSLDNDTTPAAIETGVPLRPYGMLSVQLAPAFNVGLISATPVKVTVYQDGY